MTKFAERFAKPSQVFSATLVSIGFLLVVFVGIVDHATGPEFSFSIFYLIPVFTVVWFGGRWLGIVVSILGALAWLLVDLTAGRFYANPFMPYWNSAVRLGFFLIVTFLLSALRDAQEREKLAVVEEQRRILILLLEKMYEPLTGILGNVSLLVREDLPTPAKLCLNEIQQCAQRIESVLTELKKMRVAHLSRLTD